MKELVLLLLCRLVYDLSSAALAMEDGSCLEGSGESFRLDMSERATSCDSTTSRSRFSTIFDISQARLV